MEMQDKKNTDQSPAPEAEVPAASGEHTVDYRALAERIYDLDQRVYEILGSSLGRVFNRARENCIHDIVDAMEINEDEHLVRSEVALIGNMARTIRDKEVRREVMTEYNEIMKQVVSISPGFMSDSILDAKRARLNTMLGDRFRENEHLIICISRTYGSGGNNIGFGLADALKIDYYDAEIFSAVLRRLEAEQDGLDDEGDYATLQLKHSQTKNPGLEGYVEKNSFRQKLKKLNRYHGLPIRDALYFNQSDLIVEMAKKQDFVVMGRCADVVLRNARIPHISIFITAPFERRVKRMMEIDRLTEKTARRRLKQVDREHAEYYHYYTGLKWGDVNRYDVCINSASYGIKGSIDFILHMLQGNGVKLPHHLENA